MARSNVSEFLQTIGQGVKPNMYLIDVQFPAALSKDQIEDQDLVNLLCKSAALPGSNLGVIEVPFRGRTVKIAGDRTFDTWTATFFNDKDFKLRTFFEEWANSINTHEENTSQLFTPNNSSGYTADLGVKQLEKDSSDTGSVLREYKLRYCFPTNVSQIDLAYDSNDQIEEFSVEFQYSFFTAGAGTDARAGVSAIPVV
jgi:hypothetical protein|tara:strand:- start:611 stop:1207 length:597 start_codon:yes stop_codon:yes gene_type:complete